jgi:hypothetical protein
VNKEQRTPYHAICRRVGLEADAVLKEGWAFSLCHVCRYVEWSGSDLDGPSCRHPVGRLREDCDHTYDVWGGGDCWGFRPDGTADQMAERLRDIVEWQRELEADAVEADE